MLRLLPAETIGDIVSPYLSAERCPKRDRPWLLANMIGGLDGSAAVGGRVGALSGGVDAELFRLMRSVPDIVLVGAETVRRERYGAVVLPGAHVDRRRAAGMAPVPAVAIVTGSADLDWSLPVFREATEEHRPIVITTEAGARRLPTVATDAADVLVAGTGRVDLATALTHLRRTGADVVLCEGGPSLLGELVDRRLLDELCLTLSPVMGGDALPISVNPDGPALRCFDLVDVFRG